MPPRSRLRPATALVVAVVALGGCGSDDSEVAGAPTSTQLSPQAGQPIDVGGAPVAIAADDSGVWVVDNSGGALLRLDPSKPDRKPERFAISGGPSSVALGEGAVWVASGDGTITRVDPVSGTSKRLPLRVTQPGGIAAGEGSVWVTSSAADQLVRIDPASGETVGEPIDVGAFPTDVAVGDGAVWTANTRDGTVSRVDVASGTAEAPIDVAEDQVYALAVDETGVWTVKSDDPFGDDVEVARIDPGSGAVDPDPAAVDAGVPVRIAAGEGGVWTTLVGDSKLPGVESQPRVALIDPPTGQAVTDTLPVGERPSGIATGAGALWVADAGDGTVTRIDPGS